VTTYRCEAPPLSLAANPPQYRVHLRVRSL